jgi:CheY-like chemotaxis protein
MTNTLLLVIDDDIEYLENAKEFLEEYGFDVRTTADANEACQMLTEGSYAAVLIDLHLEDSRNIFNYSGLTLVDRINAFSTIPKIIITKYKDFDALQKAKSSKLHGKSQVAEYILKMDGLPKLLEVLERLLIPKRVFISYVSEDREP